MVVGLLQALRQESRESQLDPNTLRALVNYHKKLGITAASEFDCPQCGEVLGRCPDCQLPYVASLGEDATRLICPNCKRYVDLDVGYECECGQQHDIGAIENHLLLYPEPELLTGLREFFKLMPDVQWNGTFSISGNVLRLLQPRARTQDTIQLSDLQFWRVRARHHARRIDKNRKPRISILNVTKEKCHKNNWHPSRDICITCINSQILASQLGTTDLCLPRILGLAISEGFEGIHHGFEVADVIYTDTIEATGERVNIGIHLKSRKDRTKPEGLGRSTGLVRALYTQALYSAYLTLTNRAALDVIGISVPNKIRDDVVESLGYLINELGFCFLVIDEDEWLRIVASVQDQMSV